MTHNTCSNNLFECSSVIYTKRANNISKFRERYREYTDISGEIFLANQFTTPIDYISIRNNMALTERANVSFVLQHYVRRMNLACRVNIDPLGVVLGD